MGKVWWFGEMTWRLPKACVLLASRKKKVPNLGSKKVAI